MNNMTLSHNYNPDQSAVKRAVCLAYSNRNNYIGTVWSCPLHCKNCHRQPKHKIIETNKHYERKKKVNQRQIVKREEEDDNEKIQANKLYRSVNLLAS